MIKVKHKPTENCPNYYVITGDSIEELLEECMKRVHSRSKEYYKREIKKDLSKVGYTLIDRHGGMGSFYKVVLK